MAWSDGELVTATLAGDRDAFGELVERHRRTIYALGLQRGFQEAEAEDAAQEVFVKAFGALRSLQSPEGFAKWLYGIASHVFADAARVRKRHSGERPLRDAGEVAAAEDTQAWFFADRPAIMRAVSELPEAQRLVVTLRYLEGLTPKEIAERLEQPRGTVRSHLHHALNALQTAFAGDRTEGASNKERSR